MGHRDLKTLNIFRFARSLGKKHVQQTIMWYVKQKTIAIVVLVHVSQICSLFPNLKF